MLKLPTPTGPYGEHLQRVSRSFAFCIEQLEEPLRRWVGLGYILCRMADTVEDSAWSSPSAQKNSFDRFLDFIATPADPAAISEWAAGLPITIPEGEALLLQDAPLFLLDLHELPAPVKKILQRTVSSMIRGMAHFCAQNHGRAAPGSLAEANQYCFFVAGLVGELLSELVAADTPNFALSDRVLTDGFHFGLYLQKINLLKDQIKDEKEKRFLVPNRAEMRASLELHAERSLRYIQAIPASARGYRIFCAWSYFLGLVSLPYIDLSWEKQKLTKISRPQMMLYLGKVLMKISDNRALEKLYQENLPVIRTAKAPTPLNLPAFPAWFAAAYEGRLSKMAMPELGLFLPPAL